MFLATVFLAALLQVDPAAFDPEPLLKIVAEGIEKGQWWIVLGPALALLIHYSKKFIAPRWPKLSEFLAQPFVAFLTPFVLSFLGGTATMFVQTKGMPGKAELILLVSSAIKVAVTAVAGYVGLKKLAEQKVQAAEKAAAVVVDKQAALDEMNKKP
jgi:hypothetical protein